MTAQSAPKRRMSAKVIQFKAPKPIRRKINLRTPLGKINRHWVEVKHESDPRQVIWDAIGDIAKTAPDLVQLSKILVAIYRPPMVEKTAGGVIITQGMSEEDVDEYVWQGKVGLIVAMGPRAYIDDDTFKFFGTRNEVNDWVHFLPSSGLQMEVNEVPCRLFESERFIHGRLPHPDMIW